MVFAAKWRRGPIIGRGSSATVSLALDSTSGNTFAVKSSELSNSVFLQREQRIMAAIKSQHVVSYLGFDVTAEDGRTMYNLFMEYASGGSVAEEVRWRGGGGLEEWKVRSYSRGILMGLSYLHSVGIAHCDVKGKNVLVGSEGTAKIADFGCAKWVAEDVREDCRQVIGGTPAFMAPEVARGEEQGTAADVWALGCTVIEMVTGRMPWSGVEDPLAILHRIGFSGDLPEFPKSVSDECLDFLRKCLRRNAGERWSAEELLAHPFVSSGLSKKPTWRSPKYVLDQDFWNSLEEEEDAEEEEPNADEEMEQAGSSADRLRLLGGGCGVSSSTWDAEEDWITVRCDDVVVESPSHITTVDDGKHRSMVVNADNVGGGTSNTTARERSCCSCYRCRRCFCLEHIHDQVGGDIH